MNSINKVNANNDIEMVRTTLRPDVGREPDPHTVAHPEAVSSPSPPEGIRDVIKVSDRATTIRSLVERVGQLPEVRTDRVNQFRTLVQAGSYRPDATSIADALLKIGAGT